MRPVSMRPISARATAYLVRLLLDLGDMLPQLLRILDPRFRLEERFFLRIQLQLAAVEVDGTEARFDFPVGGHDCRLVDFVRIW